MRLTVQVSQLRIGDVLIGSQRVVTGVWHTTPHNSRQRLIGTRPVGQDVPGVARVWQARTTMLIERSEA
jgi:hypothetical protein